MADMLPKACILLLWWNSICVPPEFYWEWKRPLRRLPNVFSLTYGDEVSARKIRKSWKQKQARFRAMLTADQIFRSDKKERVRPMSPKFLEFWAEWKAPCVSLCVCVYEFEEVE